MFNAVLTAIKYCIMTSVFLVAFSPQNTFAEIVINSRGEKIELKSDGTWNYVSGGSTIVFEGSKETIFHFKIWPDEVRVQVEREYNAFTNEKEFKKVWGGCRIEGVIEYAGDERVVFENFVSPLILKVPGYPELHLIATPYHNEAFEPRSELQLQTMWSSGPSERIQSGNAENIDAVTEEIQAFCQWSNLSQFRPEAWMVTVVFESGKKLGINSFWQHSKLEILHKEPTLVVKK